MQQEELTFLLTGGVGLSNEHAQPTETADWLSTRSWDELCRLVEGTCAATSKAFAGLLLDFAREESAREEWRVFHGSRTPETAPLPKQWQSRVTPFRRLLLVRALRPDKLTAAITRYVNERLGARFVEPPPLDLEGTFRDSHASTPIVFVLSAGADPMAQLSRFAVLKGFEGDRFQSISLGQGQGPIAQAMIQRATKTGSWVVLQNCHLAVSWLPTLERLCDDLGRRSSPSDSDDPGEAVHPEFRLWLTSYPSKSFPVAILQNGVKLITEAPKGLRQNLLRSYTSDPISDTQFFGGTVSSERECVWQKLLFGLCFFHAIVQERRQFGPQGFNIPYEFNESDLRISLRQLQMFLDETYDVVPFDALFYLIGQCNYGGRVTDDWDRRTVTHLLEGFFCREVADDHKYRFSQSGLYYAPPKGDHATFVEYIQSLPTTQSPELFGMHDNADISRELNETTQLTESLLLTQQGSATASLTTLSSTETTESALHDICERILSQIPAEYNVTLAMERYPVCYQESMNTVLVQELIRYNRLIAVIRRTLCDVQRAQKGLILMSSELEDVARSLLTGKIPQSWGKQSYPSLKPLGAYVADLRDRLSFLQDWIDKGAPAVYWISGFFFTQSFLTGALQNYARAHKVAIDTFTFAFEVLSDASASDPSSWPQQGPSLDAGGGVFVHGLFLDGARWDAQKGVLAEQHAKELFAPLPVLRFRPCAKADLNRTNTYTAPVYKTAARRGSLSTTGHSTNFVLPIFLLSDQPERHWIRRGVACLCSLSY